MTAAAYFRRLEAVFEEAAPRLNALDAATGDGDHGATMRRGLRAAAAAPAGGRARAFMRASGGASGTLFGLVLHEIERHLDAAGGAPGGGGAAGGCLPPAPPEDISESEAAGRGAGVGGVAREDGLAAGLRRALGRVQDLGQVAAGDKSMVDALAPAVAALEAGQGLAAAAAAARAGREATRAMAARRGRARHVEGAGRGHLDPGAVSVHLLLAVLAEERA